MLPEEQKSLRRDLADLRLKAKRAARRRWERLKQEKPWVSRSLADMELQSLRSRLVTLIYRHLADWRIEDVRQWLLKCRMERTEVEFVLEFVQRKAERIEPQV